MNTIVKNYKNESGEVIGFGITDDVEKLAYLLASLSRNNTFMPNIERIIYNDPVTKVWFVDGTHVTIKTSSHDTFNKEVGLCYAIIKRLLGKPDENGEIKSDGYMCALKRMVDKAYDQKEIKAKKEADKAKKEAAKYNPSAVVETKKVEKSDKFSLRKCVKELAETVEGLKNLVTSIISK